MTTIYIAIYIANIKKNLHDLLTRVQFVNFQTADLRWITSRIIITILMMMLMMMIIHI